MARVAEYRGSSHDENSGVQEQIDAVVEDKILEALCGADTSEMVKVHSSSCLSKVVCISWQQCVYQRMPADTPDMEKRMYALWQL